MNSTARAAFRPFLIAVLLGTCLFPLRLRAEVTSSPCAAGDAAPVSDFSFALADIQTQAPVRPVFACGAAGQFCCVNQACNSGLACNSSNVCRACGGDGNICCTTKPKCSTGLTCTDGRCAAPPPPPCGGNGQACCTTGSKCGGGLACDLTQNKCAPCGYYGTYCCPSNPPYCSEGSCQAGGVCLP
jgi:hypothetical protein